ncbi:MAG: RNA 2',3'-cyclic phosphodiesterase, partial [Rhizomicrobium sp.]
MRLFVGLSLPQDVADAVLALEGGVPGARWQHREQLHMTIRFIGETDGATANLIDDTLGGIVVPAFTLQLKGVGFFGGRMPHSLWAGVADEAPLQHLNRKVEIALQHIGLAAQGRKYIPHVTIARLTASPRRAVMAFAGEN